MKVRSVVDLLGAADSVVVLAAGALDAEIRRPAPLDDAGPGDMAYCAKRRDSRITEALAHTRATLIIIDRDVERDPDTLRRNGVMAMVISENARLDFVRASAQIAPRARPPAGVHPTAVVASSAKLHSSVHVGPLCSIGPDVSIGEGTVLHAGVHIYGPAQIGRNVTIHSGTVVGADGFGYERSADGTLIKFPHVGGVVIDDDVEIGANTCIDRGALGNTQIGLRSKVDNLVHVAHNVRIAEDAAVIALAMLGGSVRIGARSWIAPAACIREQTTIGADALVGLASLVTKDVPPGRTVLGVPARDVTPPTREDPAD